MYISPNKNEFISFSMKVVHVQYKFFSPVNKGIKKKEKPSINPSSKGSHCIYFDIYPSDLKF